MSEKLTSLDATEIKRRVFYCNGAVSFFDLSFSAKGDIILFNHLAVSQVGVDGKGESVL